MRVVVDTNVLISAILKDKDPEVLGGKPCIRGIRTVGIIVVMIAAGHSREEVLKLHP
jgi:uncharacterized protein (DUF433 family)